jgi:hypothetical protein
MKTLLALMLSAVCACAQVAVINGPTPAFFGMTNVVAISNNLNSAAIDILLSAVAVSVGTTGGMVDIRSNSLPSVPCYPAHILEAASWVIKCDGPIVTNDTTFSVNGNGTWQTTVATYGSGTTYQWQWYDPNTDWTDSSGETAATYNNPPRNESSALDPDLQRYYRCKVTRNTLIVYSGQIVLPVPIISVGGQPSGASLTVGDTFTTECGGSSGDGLGNSIAYTWTKDGSTVVGATGDTFSITNVQVGDAGSYRCVLTAACGATATSDAAVLAVSP